MGVTEELHEIIVTYWRSRAAIEAFPQANRGDEQPTQPQGATHD